MSIFVTELEKVQQSSADGFFRRLHIHDDFFAKHKKSTLIKSESGGFLKEPPLLADHPPLYCIVLRSGSTYLCFQVATKKRLLVQYSTGNSRMENFYMHAYFGKIYFLQVTSENT